MAPGESQTEFWKKKFCNITLGFFEYLNFNILRTIADWSKVLLLNMVILEWTIDWNYQI